MMALFSVISDCQLSTVVSTERILTDLDEVELPHTRYYGDQELPDAAVVSNPSTDYCSAVSEMSSRDSGHQLSPELPHSRYYGDQELPDAAIVLSPSTDYYSALSGMSRNDSGNHLSPASSVLSTEDDLRIIMEPEEPPSDTNSMLKASGSTYSSSHHNERNDFTTSVYVGASQKPNSDNHNGNFHQHYLTIGSEQQGVASSDPYSFNIGDISASYSSSDCSYPLEPDDGCPSLQQVEATVQRLPRFSDHQLSPVGSVVSARNETRVLMELDEVKLPHGRYYGDQELPDAAIGASLCNTIVSDPSTDYYSAVSEMSSHDSGHRLSPVGSVFSSEDEVRIDMEPEGLPVIITAVC